MGGQRGFRHGPPGGGSLAGPTDKKNRMAGAGSERSDAASPHRRSGSELQQTGCGSVSIRGARARLHVRPGVDPSPRPRGRGDRPHLALHPRWGRLYPRGGRMRRAFRSTPPEPRERPGRRDSTSRDPRASRGLELSRRGRPGSRPLRPTLGRGLPARSPPIARLPQEGHGRCGPPLHPLPEGQTWGPLPCRADPASERRAAAAAGPAATAATSALPARRLARPRPLRPFPGRPHAHPTRHARAPGSVAQPTCSLSSAAITTCPGSRGRPRSRWRAAASPSAPGRR